MGIFEKSIKWIIIVALVIAGVGVFRWYSTSSFIRPNKEKAEKYLQQDKEELYLIFDYLSNLDYSYITIDRDKLEKGIMFTGAITRDQKIENETVLNSIKKLLNSRKYISITKNYNTVVFEKWRFLEKDRGIAVPINKDQKPMVEFLVKYEPLSEDGWYYYEADYEEYRQLH